MLILHSRLVSRHRFQSSCSTDCSPLPARWFTTGRPLAAWIWNNKTAAKSKRLPGIRSRASALSLKTLFSAKRKLTPQIPRPPRPGRRPRPLRGWRWTERTLPKPESRTPVPPRQAAPASSPSQPRTPPTPNFKGAVFKEPAPIPIDEAAAKEAARKAAVEDEFYAILETAQPDQVMAALLKIDFEDVVATMPASVFVEALRLLSPAYFVEPIKRIHNDIHPADLHVYFDKADRVIYDEFITNLCAIVRIRQSAGHGLGLAEYTHLLDCARSIGDETMARYVWASMQRDQVEPDLQCYNHLMEAKIWGNAYTGLERQRLRITPFSYKKRRFGDPGWGGYGTGPRSVRVEVRKLFNEMIQKGHEGDETSIICLLIAYARVGDNWTMERALKATWNIDATSLRLGLREEVTKYDRTSPFYPSSRLLYAVVHAFGSANDIVGAGRILEHISTAYDIPVPANVWEELFEWAFVLSQPRDQYGEKLEGKIPTQVCLDLYEAMTKGPLKIQPTMDMQRKLARLAWKSGRVRACIANTRAAYEILNKTRQKKVAARETVESYLRYPRLNGKDMDPAISQSRGFADAVHAYDILRHQVTQQVVIMRRMAKSLVSRYEWLGKSDGAGHVWARQWLPQLLEEWREFLPDRFGYAAWTYSMGIHWGGYSGEQWCQVRRPSLMDDFDPKDAYVPICDDAILDSYRQTMSKHDLNTPLLRRLFHPVVEAKADVDVIVNAEEEVVDEEAYASDEFDSTSPGLYSENGDAFFDNSQKSPKIRLTWKQTEVLSQKRKNSILLETFMSYQ